MTVNLSKYKKLTDIEHLLLRPARYLGAVDPFESECYVIKDSKVEWVNLTYSPAFLKMFDEIVSNSVDFSKKPEGKHVTEIRVTCDQSTGLITVFDNGGIPVLFHEEHQQWLPDMLLGELRAGSNFDDDADSISTGQNGEGAALTGIFSTYFKVDTSDGKQRFIRTYEDNYHKKSDIQILKSKSNGTKIEYIADFKRLGMTSIDNDSYQIIKRRVYEIAATASHLKVYFNNDLIKQNSFSAFSKMFDENILTFETEKWKVSLSKSIENKFNHVSFVNSTCTFTGGTHIDYVMDKIVNSIRDYIEKKTKQAVKPNDIKQHFFLILDCTINNPRYSSQTKDNLLTQPSMYGSSFDFDEKFIKKIIKSSIVEEIIEWAMRKKELEDLRNLKKLEKETSKSSLRHITKYEPATSKDRSKCVLFVAEGDSAVTPLMSARDPKLHGVYPLGGKPLNVREKKPVDLMKSEKFTNILSILGLKIGVEPKIEDLRYSKIVLATDADSDGNHILGLMLNQFAVFWPNLIKNNFVSFLNTPIVRVQQGKDILEFFDLDEYHEWSKNQTKKYEAKYLKGLGGNRTEHFKKFLTDPKYIVNFKYNDQIDFDSLEIAFGKGPDAADKRKTWLYE